MLEVGDRYVLPGLTGALHSSVHQLKHRSFAERVGDGARKGGVPRGIIAPIGLWCDADCYVEIWIEKDARFASTSMETIVSVARAGVCLLL